MKKLLLFLAITLFVSVLFANPMEQIDEWAEQQTENFKTNDVVNFLNGNRAEGDITFGSEYVFNSGITDDVSATVLDSEHFVVAYYKPVTGNGVAIIGTISGNTITYGSEYVIIATSGGNYFPGPSWCSTITLDPSLFVVTYYDFNNNSYITARVGTVSGSTISFGSKYMLYNDEDSYSFSTTTLDASHYVSTFAHHSGGIFAIVGTVSGSEITFGSETVYDSGYNLSVTTLDATHFILAFSEVLGDSAFGTAVVGTISGSTITFGSKYYFNSEYTNQISATTLDAAHFVVVYEDNINTHYGTAIVGTVKESAISFGSEYVFHSGYPSYISAKALDADHFVVAYSGNSNYGTAVVGTVDGSNISFGFEHIFQYASTWEISTITLDADHFVIAYEDFGNSNYGTAIVGEIEGSPSPTGNIHISEVSDNKFGEDEETGFIELWNNTGALVSLDGYSILLGTNPGGTGFVAGAYSYPIPAGYTIPDGRFFVIGNGADFVTFNNAWGTVLNTTEYDAGNILLGLTSGFAYALDDGSKAILDETPEISSDERTHQESGDSWFSDFPETGTPGEFGSDTPLPVVLSSFTAIQTSSNFAKLNWITQSENNLSGYNVFRNTENNVETVVKINPELIQGTNTSNEQTYSFLDNSVEMETEYYYWLESLELNGTTTLFGPATILLEQNNEPDSPEITFNTGIQSIYPNPFNPNTNISYYLEESAEVNLEIFNVKGQKVSSYSIGYKESSQLHTFNWDSVDSSGRTVASGIYYFKLKIGDKEDIRKAILLK
ncbi:MAG: T9SS type A sorting domain-containing protein [Candidatus Cloacimonetes bacterium]|nr:T9SS type A sorting domain-containing protein [Candidatus Cloacimonadota bacterium]